MRKWTFYLSALLCLGLLFFHEEALLSAREGFSIWTNSILPALLPFFICTDLLRHSSNKLGRFSLFLFSFISGAPTGARLIGEQEGLSATAKSDLAAALNGVSPAYILSSFCTGMLGMPSLAIPILLSLFLSSLVMFLRCNRYNMGVPQQGETPSIAAAARRGMEAMLSVCATVMFFMVFVKLLEKLLSPLGLPASVWSMIVGALEMVNGSVLISALNLPPRCTAACAAFIFSFGGICIMTQSQLFTQLKPLRYIEKKAGQALLAAALAYIITPWFLPKAQAVLVIPSPETLTANAISALALLVSSTVAGAVILLFGALMGRKKAVSERRPQAQFSKSSNSS